MQATSPTNAGSMPPSFAGGIPGFWDRIYLEGEPWVPDHVYFRSAPARAIYEALVARAQPASNERVVELGCGGSRWLPLLARRFGVEAWGVDFSPAGVESTRRLLREAGADDGRIVVGEIQEFAERHPEMFDIVVSFGLVEHFFDLEGILAAHVKCARPGGRIFITAPNLDGINLTWARLFAADIFSWHRPISAASVAEVLERQGCRDVRRDFLGGPRLFVGPTQDGCPSWSRRQLARVATKAWNATGEILHRASPRLATAIAGSRLSPYFGIGAVAPA